MAGGRKTRGVRPAVATRLAVGALAGFAGGCSDGSGFAESGRRADVRGRGEATASCRVTFPNRSVPDGARDWPAHLSYGNGKIWALLWPYAVVVAEEGQVDQDGAITMKFPWWRGVRGALRIEGRRLDATAPRLSADVPDAYGKRGFQPSSIRFPTQGCWEVTGRVARSRLTFVTIVLDGRPHGS